MTVLPTLSPRERVLIFLALPLLLVLVGFRWGWQPLQDLRAAREAEIATLRLVALAADAAASQPAFDSQDQGASEPLAARVTASAEAAGLSLSRLEPEGERLRVVLAEAGFAQVVLWVSDLEAEEDVVLAAIELDRRTVPGTVSARLLLDPAP